ncbi:hypothetical protein GJ744_006963 [Endocarpon pusillum]|uniref:RING-type domain-containing protein n=1 Tax=Endocarpon pusillum TaxID=364733 RepID=A0A8H7E5P0_9EURO|nr:hypothetical protein GJ744_006963 [Endocarpon pusillum]
MDIALNSPVNVQRSPTLTFSPRSTPFTLVSPTVPQPDNSTLPPPAENMSSTERSSPITAPESPIMPEATSALSALLTPPSTETTAELNDLDLESTRNELARVRDELAREREQLSQVRAQLLEAQGQDAEFRARPAQVLDGPDNDPEATGGQAEVEITSTESHSTSTTPQDTPNTDATTIPEQPTLVEASSGNTTEAESSVPDEYSAQPAAGESMTEEPLQLEEVAPPADAPIDPPHPVGVDESPPFPSPTDSTDESPEWVDIEEDTSAPSEEELKEIEASNDISARDVKYHEESFYAEAPEDPEQQPSQKMRLTWVIKGVRGTKEKPNRARIMNSPAVLVGGFYWYLKFFPRGNNSSALSAYVRCSRREPKPDEEVPENTFSVVYGAPDADLGELKPAVDMSIPATSVSLEAETKVTEDDSGPDEASKKPSEGEALQHDESANASADVEESSAAAEDQEEDAEDWRVSAQIGIIIYNPEEPRTKYDMAACHQFNKHNDDWGWTNFHGPWSEIHKRRHGQRQALLRNDTLALDAYIRIFNDPSQALWWHHCGAEEQWDSVSLTGYPAMGTKLYHSPGVAGITSWLLLAPFRKIFQDLETDAYRRDSHARPQSLCSQLQMVLYLMRKQKKEEKFVSLEAVIEIMDKLDESGTDVVTFWEGFRRSLELELQTDPNALERIADIFDGKASGGDKPTRTSPLRIPVENVPSVQNGLERTFGLSTGKQSFPKFLTIELERQKFDTSVREWKLLYDRVRLDEELDLSQWSAEPETSKYTLYGFIVHAEERNSGKFYSILRPDGPGSKWLAFEDGTSNQVISYTKHRVQEFEGLEGDALRENKAPRHTAYIAMYIRTDLVHDFLPGRLEPYDLSVWLKNCPQVRDYVDSKDVEPYEEETKSEVQLEIYDSQRVRNRHGLIDAQDLKAVQGGDSNGPPQYLTVPSETTYQELRHKLAKWNDIDNVEKIKLWSMQPPSPGAPLNYSFKRISRLYKTVWDRDCATRSLCIWMHVLKTDDEVKSFGDPEPPLDHDVFERTAVELEDQERAGSAAAMAREGDDPEHGAADVMEPPESDSSPAEGLIPAAEDSTGNAQSSTNNTTQSADTAEDAPNAPHSTEEATDMVTTAETSTATPAASLEGTVITDSAEVLDEARSPPASPVQAHESAADTSADASSPAIASAEDVSLIAAMNVQDLPNLDVTVENNRQGDTQPYSIPADTMNVPPIANTTSAPVQPHEEPATEVPVAEQPAIDSTEVPAPPAPADTSNDDAQSDSSEDEEVITIRPVPFYYGFIQLFDAEGQDFIMHGDFLSQATDNVKDFVRKQLGYAADKNFLVWRRGNAYRLTSIQPNSTFEDIRDDNGYRHDGPILVVGDVLSESAKSALAAISAFTTPEPLSHYLWFSARNHPVKAHTGHITVSSFGLDYYSGHLLKGLYSGLGTHITPTGHSYTGPFLAGSRSTSKDHPEGTCTYSNGDTYAGGWSNDEKHGQGVFVEKRTGNKYVGGFQEGKQWGKGITYWEVADEEGEMCQICYGEAVDALFYDCGHVCTCVVCAKQVENCPICRKTVKQVVKIWKA